MRYRSNELNVTHALTTNDGASDFHTTLVTNNALVTDALVLTAVTLVITLRTKDLLIEESVLLRTLGTIVNGFRLRDLTARPREDAFRRRERQAECTPLCLARSV